MMSNEKYRRLIKRLALFSIIALVAMLAGAMLASKNSQVKRLTGITKGEKEKPKKGEEPASSNQKYSGEADLSDYNSGLSGTNNNDVITPILSPEYTPKTYGELMNAAPYDLIAQHQQSYIDAYEKIEEENNQGDHSDIYGSAVVPSRQRTAIKKLVVNFIKKYETFDTKQSLNSYSKTLAPYVRTSSLNNISSRKDNHQPKAIGLKSQGGSSGSKILPNSNGVLGDNYQVLTYDAKKHYVYVVVPLAIVKYTGPNISWEGAVIRRSYGFVLSNATGSWKIVRVASDSLGPIED